MTAAILFFLILTAPPLWLAIRRGARFEETVSVTTGGIILLLFLCGICGILQAGVWLILGITVLLLAHSGWMLVRRPAASQASGALNRPADSRRSLRQFLSPILTPGALAFFAAYLLLLYLHYSRNLHDWDEFTHWGDVVRAMCQVDDFATNPAAHSLFQNYVPGVSLFQYLFEKLALIFPGGRFVDWRMYFAYHLLGFIFILPFFSSRKWKLFLPVFLFLAFTAISPCLLTEGNYYITSLYVDGFVGLLAGSGFALLFLRKPDGWPRLQLWAVLVMLVLAKDVGMLFAITLAAGFLILTLPGEKRPSGWKRPLITAAITATSIAVPKILWEINIAVRRASTKFREPFDLPTLWRILTGTEQTYRAKIPAAAFSRMLTGTVSAEGVFGVIRFTWPMMAAVLALLLLLGILLWRRTDPDGKTRRKAAVWTAAATLIIYCLGLPLLYIFRFGETSSGNLVSFDRYMSIVMDSLMILVLLILGAWMQQRPKALIAGLAGCAAVCCLMIEPAAGIKYLNRQSVEENWYTQGRYESLVTAMQDLAAGEEQHVWIIAQESTGFEYWPIRYGIRPSNAELNVGWSISASTDELFPGDHWTLRLSAEDWQRQLQDYDYVIIYQDDKTFREDYAALFAHPEEIDDHTIFKVNHETGLLERSYAGGS